MRRSATAAEPHDGPKSSAPVSDEEFDRALSGLGPFEPCPQLTVGVSGGPDSMALAILAERWAKARGGGITALTVDHRLRPESAAEVDRVQAWLAACGIRHKILVWRGPYPLGDLQAAARDARYRLLGEWCRTHSVLHLLVAHHEHDQAETLLLRLARGSGLSGLAGMAAILEHAHYRLLRPLLGLPAPRLRATLEQLGQPWIEDPSNRNPRFARARVRLGAFADLGFDPARLSATANHLARARTAIEAEVEHLLARSISLHPAGFALWDGPAVQGAHPEIRLRALSALLATVGGGTYPPRFERLERLAASLDPDCLGTGRTLGGCRVFPWRAAWLFCREPARAAPPIELEPGSEHWWDGRFIATLGAGPRLTLSHLGRAAVGLRTIVPEASAHHIPRRVWASLPGLWRESRLVSVPHLNWHRLEPDVSVSLRFRPNQPLCGAGFRARTDGKA